MIVFVAGIVMELAGFLEEKLVRQNKGHHFRAIPANGKAGFRIDNPDSYSASFVRELATLILGQHAREDYCCVLSFWPDAGRLISQQLGPGIQVFEVKEPEATWFNLKKSRAYVNDCAAAIQRHVADILRHGGMMSKEVAKTNSTPLLLPVEHFRNEKFYARIVELSRMPVEDVRKIVPLDETAFLRGSAHYGKTLRHRNCFVDSRNIEFALPGMAKHGDAYDEVINGVDGHKSSCVILSSRRMGCKIDAGFHFDCSNQDGSKIGGIFKDCHNEAVDFPKRKYLNIYPNNRVRVGSK